MNYIILDFEFNQAFDFKNNSKGKHKENCRFEIIDIGAVKVDKDFNIIDEFSILIKPFIYKRLHPYVSKLTNYTMKDFKNATTFEDAYNKFLQFIGDEPYVFCVWGESDINILYKNIIYFHLNYKQITKNFINLQPIVSKHLNYGAPVISLQKACELLGIEETYPYHTAISDTKYTTDIFLIIKPSKKYISTFKIPRKKVMTKNKTYIDTDKLFKFLEKKLGHVPTDKDKELALALYNLGRFNHYNVNKKLTENK